MNLERSVQREGGYRFFFLEFRRSGRVADGLRSKRAEGGGGGGGGCSMLPVGCTRGRCITRVATSEKVTKFGAHIGKSTRVDESLDAQQPRESAARARERKRTQTHDKER